jgi:uncharacterized protein (DUF1697 family)
MRSPAKNNRAATGCYLALLRGINVGGHNTIKMTDLKACFHDIGCADVATYIQSGNVVFRSDDKSVAHLMEIIERTLSERFTYTSRVVAGVVERAPGGFGEHADQYRYDVMFLRKPLTAVQAMKVIRLKEGVDTVHRGKGVLYFSRLIAKAAQSHLAKLVALPAYQSMTIRNWNTTTRLLALMEKSFAKEEK